MPVRPNYVGPRRKEFAFDSQRFCDAEMLAAQSVAGRQQSFEHALLAVTRAVLGDQGVRVCQLAALSGDSGHRSP